MSLKLKRTLHATLWFSAALIVMLNHIDDGNVWGIYITGNKLLIGDFWSAVLVILCVLNGWECLEGGK